MKRLLLLAAAASVALGAGGDIPAPGNPPRDTHGVDMRTQAGPPNGPGGPKYSPPFPVNPALPDLWLIGDSTVRNGSLGDGTNLNQWGWGAPLTFYFDPAKVNVVNRALGGTSARSFYASQWPKLVGLIKPGDVVIMQFGTNDGGRMEVGVGDLPGVGEETREVVNPRTHQSATVHTYGWYLRRFIAETRERGATPVVCSLIPRKSWGPDGRIRRTMDGFEGWAAQVARAEHVGFIDLNELIARKLDALGREKTDRIYVPNPTPERPRGETVHTGWDGAVLNAEVVVSGLKALKDDPVVPRRRGFFGRCAALLGVKSAGWFSPRAAAIAPAAP
ncbi:MAG TPA: rhamnogalacturonan acetylesterase [Opitutaceae bacterium]|nr:rhamnogalacturonan acetylesterase [Opitutaceae bacterium]